MDDLLKFLLTVLIAAAGGWTGKKLRLPGGLLVGSMIAVTVFNLFTESGFYYSQVRIGLQIFSGAMVGSRIGKQELIGMRSLWRAVLVLISAMVLLNVVFGSLLWICGDVSLETALFAAAPGSSQDMTIMSGDFGADVGMVAILQVSRLMLIYIFIPPMIRFFDRRETGRVTQKSTAEKKKDGRSVWNRNFFVMLLFAAMGGTALYLLGISAGAMIGAMIGSAAYCVLRGKQRYPQALKTALQILSGAYVGMRLNREILMDPFKLLPPLLIMLTGIFAFTFLTSALVRRLASVDRSTAMLASCPGGIQEMSLLSDELGADTPKVAIMHTARNMSVILLFPFMIRLVLEIFKALSH